MNNLIPLIAVTVKQLPESFTTHSFVINLAQNNQREYIAALSEKANDKKIERPFQAVHQFIRSELEKCKDLVTDSGEKKTDANIFGQTSENTVWKNLTK